MCTYRLNLSKQLRDDCRLRGCLITRRKTIVMRSLAMVASTRVRSFARAIGSRRAGLRMLGIASLRTISFCSATSKLVQASPTASQALCICACSVPSTSVEVARCWSCPRPTWADSNSRRFTALVTLQGRLGRDLRWRRRKGWCVKRKPLRTCEDLLSGNRLRERSTREVKARA